MTRSIMAFFSLGLICGPDVGNYGRFDVELTEEENAHIDEVIKNHKPGYIRVTLKELYPELHEKIVNASADLKRQITLFTLYETGAFINTVDEEDEEEFWEMPFKAQVETICQLNNVKLEDVDIDDVLTQYFLTEQELPADFEGRGGCLNDK